MRTAGEQNRTNIYCFILHETVTEKWMEKEKIEQRGINASLANDSSRFGSPDKSTRYSSNQSCCTLFHYLKQCSPSFIMNGARIDKKEIEQ